MPFINFRPITAFICASLIHFSHTIHYTSASVIHFSHMCSFLIPSHILPLSIHLFIYSDTCSLELHNARGQFGNTPKSIHLIFCTLHLSFSSLIPLKKKLLYPYFLQVIVFLHPMGSSKHLFIMLSVLQSSFSSSDQFWHGIHIISSLFMPPRHYIKLLVLHSFLVQE